MPNRVVFDLNGMKVSAPGVDVLTAGEANLIFSSQWSQLSILMRGSVTCAPNQTQTVLFGKTFANRPLCFFRYTSNSFYGEAGRQRVNTNADYADLGTDSYVFAKFIVSADRFTFWVANNWQTQTIQYVIWDFDL